MTASGAKAVGGAGGCAQALTPRPAPKSTGPNGKPSGQCEKKGRRAVAFDSAPALGTVLWLDDQAYTLVGREAYVRKFDGCATTLLTWETSCPTPHCGKTFCLATGLKSRTITRRCEQHRGGLKPVKGSRGRKISTRVELP